MEPEIELVGFPSTTNSPDAGTGVDITNPQVANLPAEVVEERAQKANLGLGELSPGLPSLKASIANGDEMFSREASANDLTIKERDNRLRMLEGMASSSVPGAPISADEADLVAGLTIQPVVDPRTVWEKQYANYLTNRLVMNTDDPEGAVNGSLRENPASTFADLDVARDIITKSGRITSRLTEMEARWKEMSLWESALTIAETIIPGKTSLNISGRTLSQVLELGAIPDIVVPGRTMKEQVQNLLAISDPDVFAESLDRIVDRIAETNVVDAIDFLKAMQSYSISDQFIRNVFGLADTFDITGLTSIIGKGLIKGTVAVGRKVLTPKAAEAIKAVDDTLKATVGPQHPEKIAAQIGATNESAAMKAINRHMSDTAEAANATFGERVRHVIDLMPTMGKPSNIFRGESSLSNTQGVRIATMLENNAAKFIDTITTTVTPERLTPEALSQAIGNAKAALKKDFDRLNDSVLDIVRNPRDVYTNTDSVSIRLGTPSAETFTSSQEARLYAKDIYNLPEGSYSVGQQGTGFYIDIMKPIKETADDVQDLMVTTNNQTPIPNMLTMFMQGQRTPAEITSAMQKANRDAALFGNVNFVNFISEVAEPIGKLSKGQRRDLNTIMVRNRDELNPVTGRRGHYYDTVMDLDKAYMTHLKRTPTAAEVEAYYAAVQVNEMDLLLRNFTAYRDLSRAGVEDFSVTVGYQGYSEYGAAQFSKTPKFKGKEVDYIPWTVDHLPVALVDEHGSGVKVVYANSVKAERDRISELIKDHGYRVIQVARPQERVLKEAAGIKDPVQYVVTKGYDKTPLQFQQVGRESGFHVEYADPFYLKQPRVSIIQGGNKAYEGDATLWSFSTRAQAKKFEERVNQLREAILRNEADLSPYIVGKLPENEAWWRRQFNENEGYFNVNDKFEVVARGQQTREVDPTLKELRNLSDQDHSLTGEMDRKFQGERSEMLLSPTEGTEENPLIRLKPSQMLDPLSATSHGIGQATRSRYFGDMKISVADQFITEFGDLMSVPMDELRKYPMYYLHNPEWSKTVTDGARLNAAKAIQKTTLEFVGEQTPFGKDLQVVQSKLMDTVYNTIGERGVEKLDTIQKMVNSRDPLSYLRAWAFRAKMGVFNIQQVMVQAQSLAHMTAILPKHALQSVAATPFTRALMLNDSPEILNGVAQRMTNFGWAEKEFKESYNFLKSTGWYNVGREAAYIDDMSDPKLYEGAIGKWLDKSAIFFTETERAVRISAGHAAYREWRAANPKAVLDNRARSNILSRADTLTVNMTNASKASWERGVLSIPAQFQSYGVRMTEQMWGGQLSLAEKARVIGLNSALYGIPVGLSGVTAYGLYEDVREYALANGYTVGNSFIESMVEGIPATMASILGLGDWNVGQRYGPGGVNLVKDIFKGDKSVIEIAMGPGGSVLPDIFWNAIPSGVVALTKAVSGREYTPELNDMLDAARTISTVNSAYRVYAAMHFGKYISRKGIVLDEATVGSSFVSAITGLQPSEFSDTMIMRQSNKDFQKYQRDIQADIQKYGHRAWIEYNNGNKEAGDAYMVKVNALVEMGGFSPSQKTSIVQQIVAADTKNLADSVRRDWVMKAPQDKKLERLKNLETRQ